MYCKIAERRNAKKHQINILIALSSCFDHESDEYSYLQNRIAEIKIKLKDSTYQL
jgi:hypothetical protein